ncbi:hypothetical protein [Anatilimnocola floriformis]|uniref:hypothetical protein n=1 Tax=Anatilimnocola floriformis TaxID=2948575 RepID=UPI0020C55310|nr:hypothetical protein [Anatilimnocola floriformis]
MDAIKPHVPPQIWAMIELQRLTGMRPGEVTIMRTCDLDTTGRVWVYTPSHHKTEFHGHSRHVYLGPRAQEVLRPWLRTETEAYLFQPKDVMKAMRALRHLASSQDTALMRPSPRKQRRGEAEEVAGRSLQDASLRPGDHHWVR